MNTKIPKIIFGPLIIISAAVLFSTVLDGTNTEQMHSANSESLKLDGITRDFEHEMITDNLYSGPFAILNSSYGVDDTLFLIGSEIPLDFNGIITFIRPDGEIDHRYPFDGSKSAVNHYFTPVSSSDLEECSKCEFFGTWAITFESEHGSSYMPISFKVARENPEKEKLQ